MKEALDKNLQETFYDEDDMLYRLRKGLFYAKTIAVMAGSVYLFFLLIPLIL